MSMLPQLQALASGLSKILKDDNNVRIKAYMPPHFRGFLQYFQIVGTNDQIS